MAELEREGETTGLMKITQTEYMTDPHHLQIYEEHPDVSSFSPFSNSRNPVRCNKRLQLSR